MRAAIGTNNFAEVVLVAAAPYTVYDAALNDSDKSFVVPQGELWHLNFARASLVTSATVGNRQMTLQVLDASAQEVYAILAGAVQGAGVTRKYNFAKSVSHEAAFVASELLVPVPADLWLPEGFTLRIYDSAAVDAAADDMTVSFQANRYKGA